MRFIFIRKLLGVQQLQWCNWLRRWSYKHIYPYPGRSGFDSPQGYAIFGSDLGVFRSRKQKAKRIGNQKGRPGVSENEKRPGVSGTGKVKDQECLEPKKDQECLEPRKDHECLERPGEPGKSRKVWNRKRRGQGSLELEERRPGESGTGREDLGSLEPEEKIQRVEPEERRPSESGTGKEKTRGVWKRKEENKVI
jgi:hypothetical protein